MNAVNNIPDRQRVEAYTSLLRTMANRISRVSETLWLCITLLLFIAMGPFSVIAVVYGLWSLATGEKRDRMVEPARC